MEKFLVKRRKADEPQPCSSSTSHMDTDTDATAATEFCEMNTNENASSELSNDIGIYLNKNVGNLEKVDTLENIWTPSQDYSFPVSVHKGKNLKFQHSWLNRFKWLAYSKSKNGALCKYCVIFSKKEGGKGDQKLGRLCTKEFSNWKDALEVFRAHENTTYHKDCVQSFQNLELIKNNKTVSVNIQLDTAKRAKIQENRKLIFPVIKCVMVLGRQGIAFRGHRDLTGTFQFDDPDKSEGNFVSILRFGLNISENDELRAIREKCAKNASYTSPIIQNEIIDICGKIITQKIINDVKRFKYFSILADETTDVANIEQFSLCIRYVNEDNFTINEKFLEFVPLSSTTGLSMANVIFDKLNEFGLEIENCRGQGYDGAAAMSGKFNGVQAIISNKVKSALYVHCTNHCLNLALSSSSETASIRNTTGTVEAVYNFFNYPKRQNCLQQYLDKGVSEKTKLQKFSPTRWVERHTSISTFLDLQSAIIPALEEITEWTDVTTASSATQLLNAILACEFNVNLRILNQILSYTLPLSQFLQRSNLDLAAAMQYSEEVTSRLQSLRDNSDANFSALWAEIQSDAEEIGFEIMIPRMCKRQKNRSNAGATDPNMTAEKYYRINVFIPFLEHVLSEMQNKFVAHRNILLSFQILMTPLALDGTEPEAQPSHSLNELFTLYESDLNKNKKQVLVELEMWRVHLRNVFQNDKKPKSGIEFLSICNKNLYPNIYTLLKIFCCIPVSDAFTETTFSVLKRLKTYLRNTTSEQRLNGLAQMYIQKETHYTPEEVLEDFCKKTRRIDFKF